MNNKIEQAIARLEKILPLRRKQQAMSAAGVRLHRAAMRSFVDRGYILSRDEMLALVDGDGGALDEVRDADAVLFDARGEPTGAYPFSMEAGDFRVRINGHQVSAMCAMDALSVSPMYAARVEIDGHCAVTGKPVHVIQQAAVILNPETAGELHFGIDWGAAASPGSCSVTLCTEMLFLIDGATAAAWVAEEPANREVFDLDEAILFGSGFFLPLLQEAGETR